MALMNKNLDDMITKYYNSLMEFSDHITSKYGSLGSLRAKQFIFILDNDEVAKKLYWKHEKTLSDFERETATSIVYTCSDDLIPLLEDLIKEPFSKGVLSDHSINYLLKYVEDEWNLLEGVFDEEEGEETHEALKYLLKLPNFDPDGWLKRSFSVGGVFLSPSMKVPKEVMRRYHEAYICFIYGLFLATCAMSRSALEFMLKEKCPKLKDMDLYQILSKWDTISEIRNYKDIKHKAQSIRTAGNESLHVRKGQEKIRIFMNQITAQNSLKNLKCIFEFLYR